MQWREFLPVAIVVVLLSAIVIYGLSLREIGSSNWLQVIEVGTSGVLSLSLVFVYLWQNRILREQRQLMSAGYSPVVSIQDVSFTKRKAEKFPSGGNGSVQAINITATNRGNDIAADLKLNCIVTPDSDQSRLRSLLPFLSSTSLGPRTIPLQLEDESNAIYRDGGPALPPTMGECATLYGHLGVNYDGGYCSIPQAVDIAAKDDPETIHLGFVLQYGDASGDTHSVFLKAYVIDDHTVGKSFDEILQNGREVPRQDLDERIATELGTN